MPAISLEDHLGDIIKKATEAAGSSRDAVAKAAGISLEDLSRIEESGKAVPGIKWEELGKVLGLNGKKLSGIAGGWVPKPVDLSQWRELRVITTNDGGYDVHCYLVWDEVTKEAALFDTGWSAGKALDLIEKEQVQLKHFFLTHSHEDHIAGLAAVREKHPKVRLHSNSRHAPPDQRNRPNDFIHLGSLRITNRETPGHAEDGVTYIIGNFPEDAPNVAIIGDCIFAGSMGRGFQSADLLKQKVREQIFTLPESTLLCPGHGPLTTVGEEKGNNPFF
ncbi:MAG: MBL fold metallo-hydrolase [Verrucomicrobiota bacterium]|nr:MBL fold metallo-hydrolase [Verrucomicrobiota bacterium]